MCDLPNDKILDYVFDRPSETKKPGPRFKQKRKQSRRKRDIDTETILFGIGSPITRDCTCARLCSSCCDHESSQGNLDPVASPVFPGFYVSTRKACCPSTSRG